LPLNRVMPWEIDISQRAQISESIAKAGARQELVKYTGFPYAMLKDRAKVADKDETLRGNVGAASLVEKWVATTLGPMGLDKMIVRDIGTGRPTRHVLVTNDTAEILGHLSTEHPVAKILTDVAATVDREIGDGTTTAVVLACSLVQIGYKLTQKGIHPSSITDGYELALKESLRLCEKLASPFDRDSPSRYIETARMAITGKGFSVSEEVLAETAYSAVSTIASKTADSIHVDLKDVNLVSCAASAETMLELVRGAILKNALVDKGMPKRVEEAHIAIFSKPLMFRDYQSLTQDRIIFGLNDPETFSEMKKERLRVIKRKGEHIVQSGSNVVLSRKGIDEELIDYLRRHEVFTVRKIVEEDLARLSLATGGGIVGSVDELSTEDLGYAKVVEERKIGGSEWIFVGGCRNPKSVSIMIRGHSEVVVTEAEHLLRNTLSLIATLMREPRVVPGGGAIEVELAKRLRLWAPSNVGKKQFAVLAFAEALERVPEYLAQNAGLDPIDVLTELRARHSAGQASAGVDASTGRVQDMARLRVFDPLATLRQALSSAAEAACLILRTDGTITIPRTMEERVEKKQKEREQKGKKPEDWIDEVPY
jgi:chaperonin GroEL (HSP60 family)